MAKVECELITQDAIDVEIGGGLGAILQAKSVEITENGTSIVTPDSGFDGMQIVEINTNTPKNITGVIGVPDGMSIAQLLCGSYAEVTEIKDDAKGWTYSRNSLKQFPNAKKVTLGCKDATITIVSYNSVIEELNIDELETLPIDNHLNLFNALTKLKHFRAPKLKRFSSGQSTNISGLKECEDIDMPEMNSVFNSYLANYMINCPKLEIINIPSWPGFRGLEGQIISNNPELKKVVCGKLTSFDYRNGDNGKYAFYLCPKLVHLEVGNGTAISLSIKGWQPTYILSENPTGTDLIEEGSTASNNLQQFLQNFKTYIAERLSDNGSRLTLTLSQEVRNAIHAAEDEYGIENIIITQKGWTISPAPN